MSKLDTLYKKLESIDLKLINLNDKRDLLWEEIEEIQNLKICDICNEEFRLINKEGRMVGFDFSEDPVPRDGKLLKFFCGKCSRALWKNNKE